jgi:uncharacterized protein (DUF2235 family)
MHLTRISLPYTFDNGVVDTIRHAIALDERRRFYRTNLWIDKSEFNDHQDTKQVWFAGVHSDIGGSYPELESGLSKISLAWMVREAKRSGLLIEEDVCDQILPQISTSSVAAADHRASIHKSLKGLWWLPEFWPPFPRGARRFVPSNALIHQSVFDRVRDVPEYRPYLPSDAQVET